MVVLVERLPMGLFPFTCTLEPFAPLSGVETALARGESMTACREDTVVKVGESFLFPASLDTRDLVELDAARTVIAGEVEG